MDSLLVSWLRPLSPVPVRAAHATPPSPSVPSIGLSLSAQLSEGWESLLGSSSADPVLTMQALRQASWSRVQTSAPAPLPHWTPPPAAPTLDREENELWGRMTGSLARVLGREEDLGRLRESLERDPELSQGEVNQLMEAARLGMRPDEVRRLARRLKLRGRRRPAAAAARQAAQVQARAAAEERRVRWLRPSPLASALALPTVAAPGLSEWVEPEAPPPEEIVASRPEMRASQPLAHRATSESVETRSEVSLEEAPLERHTQRHEAADAAPSAHGAGELPLAEDADSTPAVPRRCRDCGTELSEGQDCPVCAVVTAETRQVNLAEIRSQGQRFRVVADLLDTSEAAARALGEGPALLSLRFTPKIPSVREVLRLKTA